MAVKIEVDTDDLVTIAMVARRTGQKKSTPTMWAARRASNGFPAPLIEIGDEGGYTTRLYSWKAVLAWLSDE